MPSLAEMGRSYRITGVRKAIADRLGYSLRNSLPVALMTDYDASRLIALYNNYKQTRGKESPSITAIIVKAVGDILPKHPAINSVVEGDQVTEVDEVNIAVAVETPRGLYAPTIRNVEKRTLFEVEDELRRLSARAVEGSITMNELTGHSFTVSNLGHLDVLYFTPIINPPDACILGVGAVRSEGTYYKGHLTLVFDHRVVDGAPAAEFLREVKQKLESLG
ncbi:MAG: 2-oxo acid dehydrogenase subunit E2 [Candidatus Caldarchaeum sp.]